MFHKLSDRVLASAQISCEDVARAADAGVTMIVNNRPEDEAEDQTPGAAIAAAAEARGIAYRAIPVTHAGFSEAQVRAMAEALAAASGPVLAYCRSGTRSTLLWALAEASGGAEPALLSRQAAAAGYDTSGIAGLLDMLAARARQG